MIPVCATIHSDFKEGAEVQRKIIDAAIANGFGESQLFGLRIALEEAIVNAIKHGNKLDRNKHVKINASISSKQAKIEVEDEGLGFDRSSVPDPLNEENIEKFTGRGILMIESYMTKVSWDRGGRRLKMVKKNG